MYVHFVFADGRDVLAGYISPVGSYGDPTARTGLFQTLTSSQVVTLLILNYYGKGYASPDSIKRLMTKYRTARAFIVSFTKDCSDDLDACVRKCSVTDSIQSKLYWCGLDGDIFEKALLNDFSSFKGCLAFTETCVCPQPGCAKKEDQTWTNFTTEKRRTCQNETQQVLPKSPAAQEASFSSEQHQPEAAYSTSVFEDGSSHQSNSMVCFTPTHQSTLQQSTALQQDDAFWLDEQNKTQVWPTSSGGQEASFSIQQHEHVPVFEDASTHQSNSIPCLRDEENMDFSTSFLQTLEGNGATFFPETPLQDQMHYQDVQDFHELQIATDIISQSHQDKDDFHELQIANDIISQSLLLSNVQLPATETFTPAFPAVNAEPLLIVANEKETSPFPAVDGEPLLIVANEKETSPSPTVDGEPLPIVANEKGALSFNIPPLTVDTHFVPDVTTSHSLVTPLFSLADPPNNQERTENDSHVIQSLVSQLLSIQDSDNNMADSDTSDSEDSDSEDSSEDEDYDCGALQ